MRRWVTRKTIRLQTELCLGQNQGGAPFLYLTRTRIYSNILNMNKPTCEQLFNEELESVQTINNTWRHGYHRIETFHRKEDDTYWQAGYRVSADGETNELREGFATILKVKPVKVETISYVEDKG